jgi:HEPN domain-containing protein
MRLIERRLLRLNTEIERMRRELELVEGELAMHRHLADDATRDAAVTGAPVERAEARDAAKDVARMEAVLEAVRRQLSGLEAKRDELLDRLGEG